MLEEANDEYERQIPVKELNLVLAASFTMLVLLSVLNFYYWLAVVPWILFVVFYLRKRL